MDLPDVDNAGLVRLLTMVAAAGCGVGIVWGLLTMKAEEPAADNVVPIHG